MCQQGLTTVLVYLQSCWHLSLSFLSRNVQHIVPPDKTVPIRRLELSIQSVFLCLLHGNIQVSIQTCQNTSIFNSWILTWPRPVAPRHFSKNHWEISFVLPQEDQQQQVPFIVHNKEGIHPKVRGSKSKLQNNYSVRSLFATHHRTSDWLGLVAVVEPASGSAMITFL